jgi:hypothetical protein
MVRVFRPKIALEDAIGSHTCSRQASRRVRVTNGMSTFLPVHTENCVQNPNTKGTCLGSVFWIHLVGRVRSLTTCM